MAQEKGFIEHINPSGMIKNPAFTQAVAVTGPAKTIYIGTQNAVDSSGKIVGKGDIGAQTEQILKNIDACLAAAGATKDNLVNWSIYFNQGQPVQPAFEKFLAWWGNRPNPPVNNCLLVAGSIVPDFLIGIEAIAVV